MQRVMNMMVVTAVLLAGAGCVASQPQGKPLYDRLDGKGGITAVVETSPPRRLITRATLMPPPPASRRWKAPRSLVTGTIRSIPIIEPEAVQTIGLVVPSREPMMPNTAALVQEAKRLAPILDS